MLPDLRADRVEFHVGALPIRVNRMAIVQSAAVAVVAGSGANHAGSGVPTSVGWALAAVWTLVISVVVHEGGHAVAARAFGLRLHLLRVTGALQAALVRQRTQERRTEIAVALAGPAGTLALLLVGVILSLTDHGWVAHIGWMLAVLNAVLLVLSMPPLPGTDGTLAWRARHL